MLNLELEVLEKMRDAVKAQMQREVDAGNVKKAASLNFDFIQVNLAIEGKKK